VCVFFLFFPFRFIISFAQERIEEKKEKKNLHMASFYVFLFSSSPPSPKKKAQIIMKQKS